MGKLGAKFKQTDTMMPKPKASTRRKKGTSVL